MAEDSAVSEKVAKGDVVRIDYDLYIVSSDGKEELFDTTK